ncbi:MAG TPA: hypothetical protein VGM50_01740 [Gemmatimonadaceae bacterium]
MNKFSLRGLWAAAAIATTLGSSLPSSLAAQTGLYAPLVLLLPSGTRTLGLGNTGVASRDDEVIFFNPAQLVNARGVTASGERYSANAGGGALSAATAFSNGGIGIGARAVDYDAPANFFPVDRSTMLDAGVPASAYELSVGIGQAYKGFRGGVTGKYAEDIASNTRVGRAMADVGLAKDFFRNYTVGLAVQNIGSSMSIPCGLQHAGKACAENASSMDVLSPVRTTLGASTGKSVGEFDLFGTAAVSMLRTDFVIPSGGLEANYSWLSGYNIALRAGARRPMLGEDAFTAGAGFTMDRLTIDYALETLSGGRVGHRVGLRVR